MGKKPLALGLGSLLFLFGLAPAVADPLASQPAALAEPSPSAAPSTTPAESSNAAGQYKTQFTNSVRYSAGLRTSAQDPRLIDNANSIDQDDGDRNFAQWGTPFSRFDLLSELDVQNKNFGVRVSGEAYYDFAYQGYNANNSPSTINQLTPAYNLFTPQTRNVMGYNARLLDAFVHGNFDIGPVNVTLRAGQHALLWGESIFFGGNAIAGTMAPIDLTKLLQEPNLQFKEVILPSQQVSGEFELTPELTLGAFYRVHYNQTILPPVGSYFSSYDAVGQGSQRLFIGGPLYPGGPLAAMGPGVDVKPPNVNGTEGVELLYSPRSINTEFGFYATQFAESGAADIVLNFGAGAGGFPGQIGEFYYLYPRDVHAYAFSVSKTIGSFNVALETTFRNNTDLNSASVACGMIPGVPFTIPCGDAWRSPGYAVGSSLGVNGNMIWSLPPTSLAREASMTLEVAYNDLLAIETNPGALNPNATRSAAAARFVFTPVYRQVMPDVDLSVPIGMGLGLSGYSSVFQNGFPAGGVGDYEIGLSANVHNTYTFTLGYTGFMGPAGNFLDVLGHATGQQTYSDRNFISFSASRTF